MDLPRTLPLHPVDAFYAACVPQLQSYAVAAPRAGLRLDELPERLEGLLRERFQRFCYRLPATLGVVAELRLAPEPCAPLRRLPLAELEALEPRDLLRAPGERHWALFAAEDDELCVLLLVFDHQLCHGQAGRLFLADLLAALGAPAPRLDPQLDARFRALQERLTAGFLALAPWTSHRRMAFPADPLRALARTLGLPLTETLALWLGRSLLDASSRGWPVDLSLFRMERGLGPEAFLDLAIGNRGLRLDRWELLPSGAYAQLPGPFGDDPAGVERFVRFYAGFPWKLPLAWAMRAVIGSFRRHELQDGRERLVLNNLGVAPLPFFRTMFFDPANDVDRLGLVFADGVGDQVELQFAPPRRFLAWFELDALEARLRENLERMPREPRLRAIPA